MQYPVEIMLRGIAHCDALERYIGEEARKLDRVCEHLVSCHVVAEALQRKKQHSAQFAVRVGLTLPGMEVVIHREHGEDVNIALHSAFEAAGVQIENHLHRQGSVEARSATPQRRS